MNNHVGTSHRTSSAMLSLKREIVVRRRTVYFRIMQYLGSGFMILLLVLLRPWYTAFVPDIEIHTLFEFGITIIALVVGLVAIIKFATRHNHKYLFIGFAFVGASIANAVHTVLSSEFYAKFTFVPLAVQQQPEWNVTQFVVALFTFVSVAVWFIEERCHQRERFSTRELYMINATVATISVFYIFAIPSNYLNWFALFLFLLTLAGYLYKRLWSHKYFEHWFIMFLILSIGAQLFYLLSLSEIEPIFPFAYLLKATAYGCTLVGLLISINIAFKEVEDGKDTLNAILLSIGDSVVVTDLYARIVLMNKQAELLSGVTVEHAQNADFTSIFHFVYEQDVSKTYTHIVREALHSNIVRELTNHALLKGKHGFSIPVAASAAPINDQLHQLVGCVVVIKDMRRERELEKIKDNFLSVAAHQLRSPLGAIKWNLEMLIHGDLGKLTKPVKQVITEAHEISHRLVNLANDLLMVSRIDQLRVLDKPQDVHIAEIVDSIVKELKIELFIKQVAIHIMPIPSAVPTLHIDPNHLREVLLNLITNAIKYNKRGGGVRVVISRKKDDVVVSIHDDGIGIPKQDQTRIFTKFFRASNAISKVTDGSGLGLFVVKSFIEAWGGSISFTSSENTGTTFIITLPIKPKVHQMERSLAHAMQA